MRFLSEKCTACGACAVACMEANDVDIAAGERAFCLAERRERAGRSEYVSHICRQCPDAPCAAACPRGCLTREEGRTVYDPAACVGCAACARACPFGAIRMAGDPPGVQKCHGCPGVPVPACVRACPVGALVMEG